MSTNVFAYSLHKPNNELFFGLLWAGSDGVACYASCTAHVDIKQPVLVVVNIVSKELR